MVDLSCNDRKRLSEASLGKIVNDKVFRNIKILNVFTKQWILAHVYVYKNGYLMLNMTSIRKY